MIKYINGHFTENVFPEERALMITLVNNNGLDLEANLDTVFGSYKKYMTCIGFVVDEEIDQHDLINSCKRIHAAGLKTAFDTSLNEMSKINKLLLGELDYVRLNHKQAYIKDYSPFGDFEEWLEIKNT